MHSLMIRVLSKMLSIPTFQYNCKNITEPVKTFHPYLLYERISTFTEGKLANH